MKMNIVKKIGNTSYHFQVEGDNLYKVVMESKKLSFPNVQKCGLCGEQNLYLSAHLAQEQYEYTSVNCTACRASLTFGQRKNDKDTFFLRRKDNGDFDWQPFKSDKKKETASVESGETTEEIPF